MPQLIILYPEGVTPIFTGEIIDLRGSGGSNPNPIPVPPNPNPVPPLPPGAGYQQIPCPNGQVKYNFNGPMVLDLVNQPAGKNNQLGFLRTAPQIGGDLEAGGALVEYPVGNQRLFEAPFSCWYATNQQNPGAYLYCPVAGTIRLSVLNPSRPWFLDYRTPNY